MELSAIGAGVYAAESILRKKVVKGKTYYEIKWKGYGTKDNTWEPEENVLDKRLLDAFHKSQRTGTTSKSPVHKKTAKKNHRDGPSSSKTDTTFDDEEDEDEDKKDPKPMSPTTSVSSPGSCSSASIDTNEPSKKTDHHQQQAASKPNETKLSQGSSQAKPVEAKSSQGSNHTRPAIPGLKRKLAADAALYLGLTSANKKSKDKEKTKTLANKTSSIVDVPLPSSGDGTLPSSQSSSKPCGSDASKASANGSSSQDHEKPPTNGFLNGNDKSLGHVTSTTAATPKQLDVNSTPIHHKTMRRSSPPPEVWKKQTKLADQILITDVTSNNTTITVRECRTSQGFFKDSLTVVRRPPTLNDTQNPRSRDKNAVAI